MKIVTGDLIEMAKNRDFDVIIHGCNCFNTMGGGIAALIRDAFPEAEIVDRLTLRGTPRKLGTISFAGTLLDDGITYLIVVNAYTQFKYWKDKTESAASPLVDYVAVRDAFAEVKKQFGGQALRFGIPKIGAGLAQGDWDIISKIIDDAMVGEDLTVVEFVE